jgi:hypothetical protein
MCEALPSEIGLCSSEQHLERVQLLAVFFELQNRESPNGRKRERVSEGGGGRGKECEGGRGRGKGRGERETHLGNISHLCSL